MHLSQGQRLSFGVCPLTLYVPRKKLKQNEERSGLIVEEYSANILLNKMKSKQENLFDVAASTFFLISVY